MEQENPDVEELRRYNREGCKHIETEDIHRRVAVGVGAGRIGCHMESRWITICKECKTELDVSVWDPKKLAEIEALFKK